MSDHALLIDFGSTYTKLRAVDVSRQRIVGSGQGPSTVTSDVTIGMQQALENLAGRMGTLPHFSVRLASSSAAGGLRMVTIGLVRELTAEAARQAALGAGAKMVGHFFGKLTRSDLARIVEIAPDIILLAGGTDNGNEDVILFNASGLAASAIACPIIVAGNRAVADRVSDDLTRAGKPFTLAGNVMPEFGMLDVEPARTAIRSIFMDRIVHAKGIDRASAYFDAVMMPTPAAVLEGAKLLSQGTAYQKGMGDLIVVDVGGATTDIHSICDGAPDSANTVVMGLPEPFAKRTVEGDLGMRHNARTIVEVAGKDAISKSAGLGGDQVDGLLELIEADVERLPLSENEHAFDASLAQSAVSIAMRRHAGTRETVFGPHGPVLVQRGKDLSRVGTVIGTGGPLAHGADAGSILSVIRASASDLGCLLPVHPEFYLDKDYLLYAAGLLAQVDKQAAFGLAINNIRNLGSGT
jgi:uncharacterized protein (TIGR01319 family)